MNRQNIFFALFLGAASIGCATATTPRVEPETVGQLAPSYASIAVAPVHASTDLTPSFGVVDTDEVAPVAVATVKNDLEVRPDVAPKTDGVTVGGVR